MGDVMVFWQVCSPRPDSWETITTCDSRGEAMEELRRMKPFYPQAFLVRLTATRVSETRPAATLTLV